MKVLLVGNYPADGQWSMDRFRKMLLRGLREEGVEAEVVNPVVVLGGRNKWLGYVDKFLLFPFALRRAVKTRKGWIVHIIDQGNGIYAGSVPGCVVTCHDLLAIQAARGEFPEQRTGWSGRVLQKMILRRLRKAGELVSVSEATRRDVERLIGKSVMIPNGLEDFWRPMDEDEAWKAIEQMGIGADARTSGYLLHVGGDSWYKNRPAVVRTFIDLRKQTKHVPKLVMVGPELNGRPYAELTEAGLTQDVIVLKCVEDETLRALYAIARATLFPSLAEGFGWPIIEAQACGCPVIATDKDPMRETGGEAALYAGEGEWIKAIVEVLEMDQLRRAALAAAGMANAQQFTTKKMAQGYMRLYKRLIG